MIQALLFTLATLVHPLSVSSSKIVVDGARVDVAIRCQSSTLVESLPVDTNGDGKTSAGELSALRGEIERYLLAHYRIAADADGSGAMSALRGRLVDARILEGRATEALPSELLVEFALRFDAPSAPRGLRVDLDVFRESDALHRDHTQIVWNGREPEERVLWIEDPSWTFTPGEAPRGVFGSYVGLGIEHILTGYDHIAFVVALVVASRRLRSILGVVTAFTLAHSITLALAALGVVHVSPLVVEPAIAASIAYVGLRNVISRGTRSLWPEAFGFGLIHGLGFAGSIAATLASERRQVVGLVGFNAGVEIGQVGIVAVLAGALASLHRFTRVREEEEPRLAPNWARAGASGVVAVLGLYWFVTRVSGA
jgi:hydrogenase/urease accessory protein HupE